MVSDVVGFALVAISRCAHLELRLDAARHAHERATWAEIGSGSGLWRLVGIRGAHGLRCALDLGGALLG
jgi:hypothetical protein